MRSPAYYLFLTVILAVSGTVLRADGLLLRAPEVGEYIEYEVVVVPILEDDQAALAEMQGTLRVACVGIEQTGDTTSRWIETSIDLTGEGNPDFRCVFKLLVPDDGVDDDQAFLPITRGWFHIDGVEDATEIVPDRVNLHQHGFMFMRTVLVTAEEPAEATAERTIQVNGEEVTLSTTVCGEFSPLSQPIGDAISMTLTGEGTWWIRDDDTFVPAADLIWMMQLGEEGPTKGMGIQLEAVETGSDAVTELVDSN